MSDNLSTLYLACRNGKLAIVEALLPTLTLDEIDRLEPNGSTSLHAACYFNYPQIVQLLLNHGAKRTTLNKYGCTPLDEAATDHIKQLFTRPAAAARSRFSSDAPEQEIEWTTLDSANYGDQTKSLMRHTDLDKGANSILEDPTFQEISGRSLIERYLDQARRTNNPKLFATAYSAETGFYNAINLALAQEKPIYRNRSFHEGFHSFVGCLLDRETWEEKFRYSGKSYRGMKLSREDFEKRYRAGNCFLIKPFTSTSKSRDIAIKFATAPSVGSRSLSVLCIYTILQKHNDANIALDISSISVFPDEEEVLILPQTLFEVKNINHLPSGLIEIELMYKSTMNSED
jgi:hypothetical protein